MDRRMVYLRRGRDLSLSSGYCRRRWVRCRWRNGISDDNRNPKGMKGDLLQKLFMKWGTIMIRLTSNERNYPWMDESINSFYEKGFQKYEEGHSQNI